MSPHLFTQFFEYACNETYTQDEFVEYFSLAKTTQEFQDLLFGCIYYGNLKGCTYLLNNHDYEQYKDDENFINLVDFSLYQLSYNLRTEEAARTNPQAYLTDCLIRSQSYLMAN